MLGATFDYFVLRAFAHSRNRATEEQLDSRSGRTGAAEVDEAEAKFQKLFDRFGGHLPIDPGLRYLDLGCGSGELTLAFARRGVKRITGVDFLPRNIESARSRAAEAGAGEGVKFVCSDLYGWAPEGRYDVLLSFDALEHIEAPGAFLRKIEDFIAPGGVAVLAFGPLFHSPFGDHMWDFFRLQIPWRGILFSEQALLRVRKECFRPTDPARSYAEIAGGLNLIRYSEFLQYVRDSGWRFDYLAVNAFLKRKPLLRLASDLVTSVPHLGDYFTHDVYAVLRR
jgi:SAM-dependent methyltransferase